MLGRSTIGLVAAAAVLLAGCGEPPSPTVTDDPAADPALLDGVPGECQLASVWDAAMHERLLAVIDAGVDHGPIVVAQSGGETVVATTTYERPGVEGRSAAWTVDGGEVVAANQEAARISQVPVQLVETADGGALAAAMAEAEDCSLVVADRSAEDPPEPEPGMRPDLLVIEPPVAGPGDVLALRFPQETPRGIAFDLDRRTAGEWQTTHWMTSDANGSQYAQTVPVGTEGFAVIDVGVGGPGQERVQLPDDLAPGEYRVCTANAGDEFCAPLTVTPDGLACGGDARESSNLDYEAGAEPAGASPLEAAEAQVRDVFGDDVEFRETGPTSVEVARPDGAVVGRISLARVPGGFLVEGYTRCG